MSTPEVEPSAKSKKKRVERIEEPPFGFGRDIELALVDPGQRRWRAAIFVLGIAFFFLFAGGAMAHDDPRGRLVQICGVLLIGGAAYMAALARRHQGRSDFHLLLTHRRIDVPRVALFGPMRVTCALNEIASVALMRGRAGLWIELQPFGGRKTIIPAAWLEGEARLIELYWRLELRVGVARRFRGKTPRHALVGAEAMVVLASREGPILGVVLSKIDKKRPVVLATVRSIPEFFSRLSEWPPDAKLSVADDVHAAFREAIVDPTRLL